MLAGWNLNVAQAACELWELFSSRVPGILCLALWIVSPCTGSLIFS